MRKTIDLKINQIASGGEGIASYEGKKIFIPWGVPDDLVKIEIVEEQKDYSRGKILEVLEKSPARTDPPCPYFFKCGGCQWQQIQYRSQLEFKNELLKTALQRTGKIQNPTIKPIIKAPKEFYYRNRIRLQVSQKGEVGFFKLHSQEVIPIEKCLIADERINAKIVEAKKLAETLNKKDHEKLYEIEIQIENEKVFVKEASSDSSVFGQINSLQNEELQKLILHFFDRKEKDRILELFAGDGNFTFPLSRFAQSITAIESNSASIDAAREKTKRGHFKNIQWIESTSYRALQQLSQRNVFFDSVLLDPPRKGAQETLEGIAKLKIPQIIYVSCDPATLARDVQNLIQLGYQHNFSQIIDMFPQTYHIESVTQLTLR